MRILVGVCIITLALLGCDLSDKPEQAVQTFFENSQSSDISSDEIVTEGIFSNLKLYVAEHRLLVDIKNTIISLKDPNYSVIPPVYDYNEEAQKVFWSENIYTIRSNLRSNQFFIILINCKEIY